MRGREFGRDPRCGSSSHRATYKDPPTPTTTFSLQLHPYRYYGSADVVELMSHLSLPRSHLKMALWGLRMQCTPGGLNLPGRIISGCVRSFSILSRAPPLARTSAKLRKLRLYGQGRRCASSQEAPSAKAYLASGAIIGGRNLADVKKVLVIGSGGLSIGQAGEFDYSGE